MERTVWEPVSLVHRQVGVTLLRSAAGAKAALATYVCPVPPAVAGSSLGASSGRTARKASDITGRRDTHSNST